MKILLINNKIIDGTLFQIISKLLYFILLPDLVCIEEISKTLYN